MTAADTISRSSAISFPLFGDIALNPPSSVTVFGREIYLYGILIALAFLLGLLWCDRHAAVFSVSQDNATDVFLRVIPAAIIGARIYYVLFRLEDYAERPGAVFAVWEGGLAVYGGILAGIGTVFLVCRRKGISSFALLDLFAPALLLGQAIGRWGNFFNREAFGSETAVFCRMGLTPPGGQTVYVHPTFLYESLWDLLGFLLLDRLTRKGKHRYDGEFLFLYFVWYGSGRAWIEGLRTDSLLIPGTGLRVSQLLSIVLAFIGAFMLIRNSRRPQNS